MFSAREILTRSPGYPSTLAAILQIENIEQRNIELALMWLLQDQLEQLIRRQSQAESLQGLSECRAEINQLLAELDRCRSRVTRLQSSGSTTISDGSSSTPGSPMPDTSET